MTTEPKRRLDEYQPQEMAIPEWRLIQKTGADYAKELGGEPGQFFNTVTAEIANELNIVIVDILSGRTRWGQEITSSGPICASLDARSNRSVSGMDCSDCEFRVDTPWSINAPERRQKCCLNYTLLGIDLDHDHTPMIFRMHGISAVAARQLITQLRMNRSLKGEYHRAIINVKSAEKTTPYGIAYATHIRLAGLIEDEVETQELKIESQRLLGAPIPLPEGRPEEEAELESELKPLGFTPKGTPFFSEEEKERLLAQEAVVKEIPPPPVKETLPPPAGEAQVKETTPPPAGDEPPPPPPAEEKEQEIDVDI